MSKTLTLILLLVITFVINIIQVSLFFPLSVGHYAPDINLIFIIYLAISKNLPFRIVIVILNGYLMDLMSGNMLAVHTFSRLSLFVILASIADYLDFDSIIMKLSVFFCGTAYCWFFLYSIALIKSVDGFNTHLFVILTHAAVNSLLGVSISRPLYIINAKTQK